MKIREVIEKLEAWHGPLEDPAHTADTVKIGDPEQECTGIAVTVHATVDAISEAASKNCNLLITHEPLFYGDAEGDAAIERDPVYLGKRSLIEENGIVVYRDHDHIHGPGSLFAEVHTCTDYIFYGIMKELGWEAYVRGEETKPLRYEIPETTGGKLAELLVHKLGLNGARLVGDPEMKVRKVFFCEHLFGGPRDYAIIAKCADADALIPLEIVDWTLSSYVRDSCALGRPKVLIEMGHFNTEEPGMRYMTKWLGELLGGEVPVAFVKSGDGFHYLNLEGSGL